MWDNRDTLAIYGLAHPPSESEDSPVLPGMTRSSMALMAQFTHAIERRAPEARCEFIDNKKNDDEWSEHRIIWKKWYTNRLARKVNSLLDEALRADDNLPHQRMRGMMSNDFPPLDTVCQNLNTLATALFSEDILSGDQVHHVVGQHIKTLVSHALTSRWLPKYKMAMHILCGHPLKKAKGKSAKTSQNHLGLLESLMKSE